MTCHYCSAQAIGIDLCHAQAPICALHREPGHQYGPLPKPVKPAKKG